MQALKWGKRMTPDVNALDLVINKTVHVVNQSKNQIFDISEQARTECDHLQHEIERLKAEVVETIKRGDRLERELTWARKHLAEVSREFESYNEVHIKEAYERANKAQSQMILAREQEKHLRKRRDDLQLRLQKLSKTVDKAEDLMTQMNVIMDYLSGDLQKVGQVIEDAKQQQKLGLEVIQAQEEERKRVAREIHDGPAQQMANVVLRTELVERMFHQQKDQEAKEELKYRLLSRAHLLLVPGVREGWGLVVTEANAMGTPAVAYDVHGLRDSVRDGQTGVLVKEKTPQSLARSAISLLQDRDTLDKLSFNALAFSKEFSWDNTADEFDRIIQKRLLENNPQAHGIS
jgi:glycosyltransferase involved in cell wall biosynthesis